MESHYRKEEGKKEIKEGMKEGKNDGRIAIPGRKETRGKTEGQQEETYVQHRATFRMV